MGRRTLAAGVAVALLLGLVPPARAAGIDGWTLKPLGFHANGIAYAPLTASLLATVPGGDPNLGNQLVELDPDTGEVRRRVHVGSDPADIDVTDDGTTAYVALRGANEVVRVDLLTFTVLQRIVLGSNQFGAPHYARDVAAAPGRNDLVVVPVAGRGFEGVLAFENGLQLPDRTTSWPRADRVEFTAADRLHAVGFYGEQSVMRLHATGLGLAPAMPPVPYLSTDLAFVNGLLYSAGGAVYDPETERAVRRFPAQGSFAVSPEDGLITYREDNTVLRFDTGTGELVESRRFDELRGWHGTMVSTAGGFALTANGGLFLLGPTVHGPAPGLPPALPSTIADLKMLSVPLETHSAVYDPLRHLVYATVGHGSKKHAEELVAVDPDTGTVRRSLFIGFRPGPLAISEDATTVYVGQTAANRVVKVDPLLFLPTGVIDLGRADYAGGPVVPTDIAVRPGTNDTIAVSRRAIETGSDAGVVVYRNGDPFPTKGRGSLLAFTSPTTLSGADDESLQTHTVDTDVSWDSTHDELFLFVMFKVVPSGGLLYTGIGSVVDPVAGRPVARLPAGGAVAPVPSLGRVYATNGSTLSEVDLATSRFVASRPAPDSGVRTLVATATGLASAGGQTLVTFSRSPLVPAPPAVHGFTPSSAPGDGGTNVVVTGTGFTNAYAVRFGTAAADFTVVDDTTIVAVTPNCCASRIEVPISVTAPPGTGTSAEKFVFEPPPSSTTTTSSSSTSTTTSTTRPTTTTSTTTAPVLPSASPQQSGYWMVGGDGRVHPFGDARLHGHAPSSSRTVDLEPTRSRGGYWVVDEAGHVSAFGDARRLGDAPALAAGERVTSLSRTASGNGYWLFTTKGRVLPYGDAVWLGDMAGVSLNGEVLDSVPTPSGKGYYMVASDGGIFTFGDARFAGSMGAARLNAPVQSLAPDPDGRGYWLVASDGGIFAFDAPFHGSMGATRLNRPVTGMVGASDGYLMVAEDGGIFTFGNARFRGSLGASPPAAPVAAVATY